MIDARGFGIAILLAILASLSSCSASQTSTTPERIILVVIDTLRRDHVSFFGDAVETPHIDALASRGEAIQRATSSFHRWG